MTITETFEHVPELSDEDFELWVDSLSRTGLTEDDVKIHHPPHYTENRQYEPIAVIEDWALNYHLGNAVKYISRAGRKDDYETDLKKAIWYIEREIERAKGKLG